MWKYDSATNQTSLWLPLNDANWNPKLFWHTLFSWSSFNGIQTHKVDTLIADLMALTSHWILLQSLNDSVLWLSFFSVLLICIYCLFWAPCEITKFTSFVPFDFALFSSRKSRNERHVNVKCLTVKAQYTNDVGGLRGCVHLLITLPVSGIWTHDAH